jgi:ribosomal protein S18 acetylase RimI-like enzyme
VNTNIRQATVADANSISALNVDVQQLHVDALPQLYKPVSAENFPPATILDFMTKPQYRFFITSEDEVDVGYIFLEVIDLPETGLRCPRQWVYIHAISVKPTYQAHGHGQRLIESAKALAKSQDIHTIVLDTMAFNAHAHQFFERQGFTSLSQRMWMEVDQ